METKKIILLLIVLSVIISGCLSSENGKESEEKDHQEGGSSGGSQRSRQMMTPEEIRGETWTPKEMGTEGEVLTPEETGTEGEVLTPEDAGTQEETDTPIETETQAELGTPGETETSGAWGEPEAGQTKAGNEKGEQAGAVQTGGTALTSHLVRLKDYLMIPSRLEINTGDTVVWRNYQESSVLVLTSREHLFEDQRLAYGNTLEYTFNEPGSYSFSVKGYPKMQMTITVK